MWKMLIILISIGNNIVLADFLYCNAGVTIYHSMHSASLQQSNGTRANFEYNSTINTKSATILKIYRGTDAPAILAIPEKIQGTANVLLELDGNDIQFNCHK